MILDGPVEPCRPQYPRRAGRPRARRLAGCGSGPTRAPPRKAPSAGGARTPASRRTPEHSIGRGGPRRLEPGGVDGPDDAGEERACRDDARARRPRPALRERRAVHGRRRVRGRRRRRAVDAGQQRAGEHGGRANVHEEGRTKGDWESRVHGAFRRRPAILRRAHTAKWKSARGFLPPRSVNRASA